MVTPDLLTSLREVERRVNAGDYLGGLRLATAAVIAEPRNAAAWYWAGRAYFALNDYEHAAVAFAEAAALAPHVLPRLALAGALLRLQRSVEALAVTREIIRDTPAHLGAWMLRGDALADLGVPFTELVGCYVEAARYATTRNQRAVVAYNRALAELRFGHWDAGWRGYDQRWDSEEFVHEQGRAYRVPAGRRWRGGDLAGGHLLVWGEQGVGDVLMCLRWLPLLRHRFAAGRVTLRVTRGLVALLEANRAVLDVDAVLCDQDPLPAHDAQIPVLSLPVAFGVATPDDVRGVEVTLRPPAPASAARDGRPRVGLVWAGNPVHPQDRRRSLPDCDAERLIRSAPDVRWVSFMHRLREETAQRLAAEGLLELPPAPDDGLAATANRMATVDAVLGVDTGPLHLAAVLGVPTVWLIAGHHDWRWLTAEAAPAATVWYQAARLVRQPAGAAWDPTLDRSLAVLRDVLRG